MLDIIVSENTFGTDGKPFAIRSRTSETLSYGEVVDVIEAYHSTLTRTDITSVLEQFSSLLFSNAAQGIAVKTPFGTFKAYASGSLTNPEESYNPSDPANDHDLNLRLHITKTQKKQLIANLKYQRASSKYVSDPFIQIIYGITNDGVQIKQDTFSPGQIIRLRGECLKIDSTDTNQGVFFTDNANGVTQRITHYIRRGSGIIDFILSSGIDSGTYTVKIVTKPGSKRYEDFTYKNPVVIK